MNKLPLLCLAGLGGLIGLVLVGSGSAQRIEPRPVPLPLPKTTTPTPLPRVITPSGPSLGPGTLPRVVTPSSPSLAPGASTTRFTPKFEPLAETRLLMEGMAHANYRSISKQLKNRPADADTWVFIRGQTLLVAETGNLLLLRPPRNTGRDTWMKLAMEMRDAAGALARAAGSRDYPRSRTALEGLTNACNKCHTTFRIPVQIGPEEESRPEGMDVLHKD